MNTKRNGFFRNVFMKKISIICMSDRKDRVYFHTSNGSGRPYLEFRHESADFKDRRGYGYRLNNVSPDTQSDQIYAMIQDILNGLRRSGHLQGTRISDITSPYEKRRLLPFMTANPRPMRDLLNFNMPATSFMEINVKLDPVTGGRKRKSRRKTRRLR